MTPVQPRHVDRTVGAGGESVGVVVRTCSQQLSPGFRPVGVVLAEEGIDAAAVGLPVEAAHGTSRHVNCTVGAGGESGGAVLRTCSQQSGPGFCRVSTCVNNNSPSLRLGIIAGGAEWLGTLRPIRARREWRVEAYAASLSGPFAGCPLPV